MNVEIFRQSEGVKRASGLVVIIDVFRAFSTACYVADMGAEKIIPIDDIRVAYQLKKENPNFILIGERNGHIQVGFDYGNSPFQIRDLDLSNKVVIQTTSAGTKGMVNVKNAEEIISGSFVNAGAIIKYIKLKKPKNISLVCTRIKNASNQDEDAACANYIKNSLLGNPTSFEKIVHHLRTTEFAKSFFDPSCKSHPMEDFALCMTLNKFDFVLKAEPYARNLICLKRKHIK